MDILKYDDDLSLKRKFDESKEERAIYDDWVEWAAESIKWSRRRRSRATTQLNRVRHLYLPLAVVGMVLMFWFCTFPTPYEYWYVGLVGILLALPLFVKLTEERN